MKRIFFYLFALFALLVVTACSDENRNDIPDSGGKSSNLTASADFIRLSDDSTNVAGVLLINACTPKVELKWNVPMESNIDTTQTTLDLPNGTGKLPIKWIRHLSDSVYGPTTMAFNGGVLITSGEYSKYVSLIWADEVDSTAIAIHPVVCTRATDEPLPVVTELTLSTNRIDLFAGNMSRETLAVMFNRNVYPLVNFKKDNYSWKSDLIYDNLPSFAMEEFSTYEFGWKQDAVPTASFVSTLIVSQSSISKYVSIIYTHKIPEPPMFQYEKCIPATTSLLSSVGAVVAISANTNQKWQISSTESALSPTTGPAGDYGLKTLAIAIDDNPTYQERDVQVSVTSELGGDPVILNFRQQAKSNPFTVTNITPSPGNDIPALGGEVNVNVLTDVEWWIESLGQRADISGDKLTGKITIPTNPGTTERKITVRVGHGGTIDTTFVYKQLVGNYLEFASIMPIGNIPVTGGNYTLTFFGDYAGGILVEAYIDDMPGVLTTSNTAYDKKPLIQIPANSGNLNDRTIKFRYKKENSNIMEKIPTATKIQNGTQITPNEIYPNTDIAAKGGTYKCSFSGIYSGTIYVCAKAGGVTLVQNTGTIGQMIDLLIPSNTGTTKRTLTFFYSGNGTDWIEMTDTRVQQVNATIGGGGNTTVNEFGDEEIINGKIEL